MMVRSEAGAWAARSGWHAVDVHELHLEHSARRGQGLVRLGYRHGRRVLRVHVASSPFSRAPPSSASPPARSGRRARPLPGRRGRRGSRRARRTLSRMSCEGPVAVPSWRGAASWTGTSGGQFLDGRHVDRIGSAGSSRSRAGSGQETSVRTDGVAAERDGAGRGTCFLRNCERLRPGVSSVIVEAWDRRRGDRSTCACRRTKLSMSASLFGRGVDDQVGSLGSTSARSSSVTRRAILDDDVAGGSSPVILRSIHASIGPRYRLGRSGLAECVSAFPLRSTSTRWSRRTPGPATPAWTWAARNRGRVLAPRRGTCPRPHGGGGGHPTGLRRPGASSAAASPCGTASPASTPARASSTRGTAVSSEVLLVNHDPDHDYTVERGDRIAQLVIVGVEEAEFVTVARDGLGEAVRGSGGFGHTGT